MASRAAEQGVVLLVVKNLDLLVLAAALAVFLLADLPLLGYAAAAAAWLAQRAIGSALERRASAAEDPRAVVGLLAGGSMARAWLTALSVLAIGLVAGERAGLAAVLLVLALFTTYFTSRLIVRGVAA